MNKIIIGIDGGQNNGLAVFDTKERKFTLLRSYTFWDLIEKIKEYNKTHIIERVVIEATHLVKPTFKLKGAIMSIASSPKSDKKNLMCLLGTLDRRAQNLGENKRTTKLIVEYLERKNIAVEEIPPSKKTGTKINNKEFSEVTGYIGRTNEHSRDAGMLVHFFINREEKTVTKNKN
ncbi:MAG: hypothetical protein GY861_21670 [bacterium]|nr:hypothetical protein [bacterium]